MSYFYLGFHWHQNENQSNWLWREGGRGCFVVKHWKRWNLLKKLCASQKKMRKSIRWRCVWAARNTFLKIARNTFLKKTSKISRHHDLVAKILNSKFSSTVKRFSTMAAKKISRLVEPNLIYLKMYLSIWNMWMLCIIIINLCISKYKSDHDAKFKEHSTNSGLPLVFLESNRDCLSAPKHMRLIFSLGKSHSIACHCLFGGQLHATAYIYLLLTILANTHASLKLPCVFPSDFLAQFYSHWFLAICCFSSLFWVPPTAADWLLCFWLRWKCEWVCDMISYWGLELKMMMDISS